MALGFNSPFGDFTVFGFTRNPDLCLQQLSVRLGITLQGIQIGSLGQFFYYTSYGDVAESEEEVVLKLGFLRSTTKSVINARQLLDQKLVGPKSIDNSAFSGNALVVGISKTEPVFSAFKTLMAMPQLYYAVSDDGILCSDVLRCIVRSIPHCELDEAILPQHFLFRTTLGSFTYYRGVQRLLPGNYLKWANGNLDTRLKRTLDAVIDESEYIRDDSRALKLLYESLQDVVGDYITQIETGSQGLANLLSGGVDSTFIQYFINAKSSQRPSRSISYAIRVPAFKFEVEYARQASQLLNTAHTFVEYSPQDYPGLLNRAVDILAQPPSLETEPSMLAIAEFVRAANWPERYFFTALAADSLFGERESLKLKGLHYIQKLPFASCLLRGLGTALAPVTGRSKMLIKGAEIIASECDPDAYASPSNFFHVYVFGSDWEVVRHCFGDRALREAQAYRRNLAAQYSKSHHYLDKVHFIDLLTDTYEITMQRQQLFLAHNLHQVDPFSDEDLLKVALTFHPDMRYIKGLRYKHLLKRLLQQKINAPVARKRKGGSTIPEDLITWMRSGPLNPLVEDIHRPGFMSKADFESVLQNSNYFLWRLLTFDIFHKRVLENRDELAQPNQK
jgi:asparagine synthetase B (glutamine-hydrolysing)